MKQALIGAIVLLVLGAAGAFWFLTQSATDSVALDAKGQALIARVATERARIDVDSSACRELLSQLEAHPAAKTSRRMIRARAWMELLLGRDARAWNLIEPSLAIDVEPEDEQVAMRILERRFANNGDQELAHRGAILAEHHYRSTQQLSSLFLAWQLQVRRGDRERRDVLAKEIVEAFPDSDEASLVKVLVLYPDLREEAAGAEAEMRKLENSMEVIPVELDLALALFEIQSADTVSAGMERVERVLQVQPSSITGRFIGGMGAIFQKRWDLARSRFSSLLRNAPDHPQRRLWEQMRAAAAAEIESQGKK